jgi:cysteine synthase
LKRTGAWALISIGYAADFISAVVGWPCSEGDHMSSPTGPESSQDRSTSPLKRRTLFAGAGTAGALAATAALLPASPPAEAPVAQATPVDPEGGYQLTEHVQRYYQTARV